MSKVAIITGGSSGIGKALAEVFGNQGYKIVITGRKTIALEETVKNLKEKNIICLGIQADVSIENDNKRVVDETIKQFGQIDILINNAGIAMRALFEEMDLEVMHQVMNINFFWSGLCHQICFALFVKVQRQHNWYFFCCRC